NPAYINYPGENGHVLYGEGLFVGYRYYDRKDVEPLFPFGFGLSYTGFAYHNLRLSATAMRPDERITVSVDVTNTGARPGTEVVQLYVGDSEARLARPDKELKGFAKIALQPGETTTITFTIDRQALSYYDPAVPGWVAEPGEFVVFVGRSAADIRLSASFELVAA
uniref:fibronectin type III-like domain-contianing protein n=1 Tax=Chloroflexus sp. TaxID=1904827 RepID=UPI002ACD9B14